MKKVLVTLSAALLLLLVLGCGSSKSNGDDGDTANSGDTADTGNTGDTANSGNTGNPDTGAMVSVPAGKFWMGCNEEVDDECYSDEHPYHEVTLSAYKIDKYQVTAGEYQKCVDAGNCNNDNSSEPHYRDYGSSCNLGAEDKSNHPMNCVSWYGAKAYCEWAGKRLPTEAEWEKAARGTEGAKYPWGNEKASCKHAVMDDGGDGCGLDSTWAVGSKPKGVSPYGCYDMIGNVWEWVNDWYDSDYYETSPSENPKGPESGSSRVLRGGSWFNYGGDILRASDRYYGNPGSWTSYDGFRCAK
ncbi:MAG: formylglycine-generating enzyme family protein [bacterium]